MSVIRTNCPELEVPAGPYVHAARHGHTLYTSGLTAFGSASQSAGIAEQARVIFEQLTAVARQHDATLADLIKVTIFVTDLGDLLSLREVLAETYGKALPASSLVAVAGLFHPDLKIEIEAIIAIPQ